MILKATLIKYNQVDSDGNIFLPGSINCGKTCFPITLAFDAGKMIGIGMELENTKDGVEGELHITDADQYRFAHLLEPAIGGIVRERDGNKIAKFDLRTVGMVPKQDKS